MNRIFAVVLLMMLICGMVGMSLNSSASIAFKSELHKFQTRTLTPTPLPSPSQSPTATPVPEPEPVPSPTPTPFSRLRDHV